MKKSRRLKSFRRCFILSVLLIGATVAFCMSPLFDIKEIKVNGNNHYTKDEIKNIVNINLNDNWFRKVAQNSKFSVKSIAMHRYFEGERQVIKECPYIKNVKILLVGLGKYKIDIEERQPVARVSYHTTYVVVDQEGVALDITDDINNDKIPKINGIRLKGVRLGDRIDMSEDKVKAFYHIYETIKKSDYQSENLYDKIDYIDLNDVKDTKLFLDNRILVYLGNERDINLYKINYVKEIFFNKLDKEEEGILKFRNKGYPTFTKKTYALAQR
ncbi:MAG: FtsQ-type POTRA domain-containing protein [Clostridiales bacterium]|nr:FtsQ-type POTRA domain-containing protein [Clostridiales bacterium]